MYIPGSSKIGKEDNLVSLQIENLQSTGLETNSGNWLVFLMICGFNDLLRKIVRPKASALCIIYKISHQCIFDGK